LSQKFAGQNIIFEHFFLLPMEQFCLKKIGNCMPKIVTFVDLKLKGGNLAHQKLAIISLREFKIFVPIFEV
jgi:hypothetical protein